MNSGTGTRDSEEKALGFPRALACMAYVWPLRCAS